MLTYVYYKSDCGNTITACRSRKKEHLNLEISRDTFTDSTDVPITWFEEFVTKYHNGFPGVQYPNELGIEGFTVKIVSKNDFSFFVTINNEKACDIVKISVKDFGEFIESCLKLYRSF